MKRIQKLFFASLFLAHYFGCSKDNPEEQTQTTDPEIVDAYEALNVSYGPDENQVFDIYLPENRTHTTKILILIHGGSWISGDKMDMNAIKVFVTQMWGLLT